MKYRRIARRMLRLPSPATVIASIALIVATAGVATAARSSTGSKPQAAAAVTPFITGAHVLDNSLTGADINEATLSTVPAATNATNAGHATSATSATSATNATNATNAGNSNALNGYSASSLTRVARMSTGLTTALGTTCCTTYGGALTITAPAAGFVYISGSFTAWNSGCGTSCRATAYVYHAQDNSYSTTEQAWAETNHFANIALSWVFPVTAGVNTFNIRAYRDSGGDGTIYAYWGQMAAIYSPFGSTGSSTLGPVKGGGKASK